MQQELLENSQHWMLMSLTWRPWGTDNLDVELSEKAWNASEADPQLGRFNTNEQLA
jgi:hypothetical protein